MGLRRVAAGFAPLQRGGFGEVAFASPRMGLRRVAAGLRRVARFAPWQRGGGGESEFTTWQLDRLGMTACGDSPFERGCDGEAHPTVPIE